MAASDAQANGLAADGVSVASSGKRKRDTADESDEAMTDADKTSAANSVSPAPPSVTNGSDEDAASPAPVTTTTAGNKDEKRLIRDYFEVLKSYDIALPPILKRPLPSPAPSDGEPLAKRHKPVTNSGTRAASIADRVASDAYALLDDLVLDIAAVVNAELDALKALPLSSASEEAKPSTRTDAEADADADAMDTKDDVNGNKARDAKTAEAVASGDQRSRRAIMTSLVAFRERAHELYRRETAYPQSGPQHGKTSNKVNGNDSLAPTDREETILTVFGNALQPRQLFSSLPDLKGPVREDIDLGLGGSVTLTRMFPPPADEKASRAPTFGELFPSPRNLPPLQPPKAPKTTTKATTLGFYHPELVDKSKYRSGSYFTQTITTGQWLDYSNATPTPPVRARQRERAQSLAGRKPSTTELELSEMESLFRGAFSSFAPSKDDSAAIVPTAQMGRMWWQRVGHRVFERMVEASLAGDVFSDDDAAAVEVHDNAVASHVPLDEEALEKTIADWDDSLVDPSLEEVMGEKSKEDKDIDEVLQEVSDLIVTLASYQRNRNLTLPTSQDRFSADPVNADMLRNGALAQQPSEEEMLTYQTLKAQLALIIQGLPPYAVARLNSDKLAELNISTKIEIRSEAFHGVLEEDEAVLRANQAANKTAKAAVANSPQRTPAHRASSEVQFNSPGRAASIQGGSTYYAGAGQPGRGSGSRPVGTPAATLPPHVRAASQGQPFRSSPNGYGNLKGPQQQQSGVVSMYPGSPAPQAVPVHMSPQRMVSQPAIQAGTTQQFRLQQGGTPGYAQQQPPPQQVTPQGMSPQMQAQQRRPSQGLSYTGSPANGATHLLPQQQQQQQRFLHPGSMTPQQQQQQQQQQVLGRSVYAGAMTPQAAAAAASAGQRPYGTPGTPGANLGPVGYHTVMDQPQQQRLMEQARARASAHERSLGFGNKLSQGGVSQNAGLVGIGLSGGGVSGSGSNGGVDMAKLAAARANMPGSVSPQPPMQMPQLQQQQQQQLVGVASPAMNGTPPHHLQSPSPMPSSVSPAPSGGFAHPV